MRLVGGADRAWSCCSSSHVGLECWHVRAAKAQVPEHPHVLDATTQGGNATRADDADVQQPLVSWGIG